MQIKKVVSWIVPVLVLGGIGVGVWKWQASRAEPEITYKTVPAEKRRFLAARVTASGTLSATVTVEVGAQVSGRISVLKADFNSTVKKGEVVAKLDPQLFIAALEQAQANHVSAKANLVRSEAQEKDADATLKRVKNLSDQGLAAASELQTAQTAVLVAQAQTEVSKAALKQTQAALNQAEVNLSFTTIKSPIDGVVISRNVDVGQTVAASLQAPVLFTIAEDLKKMQVHTSVAEGDVGRLQPEMDAWFTVDAFPGQRFKGKISQIRNAATTLQNVVTYDAVIDVDNPDLKLRPGMTATTTIVYAEKHDVLALPNTALRFKPPAEVTSAIASASAPTPAASLSITAAGPEVPSAMPAAPTGRAPRMRRSMADRAENPERTIYVLRGGKPEPVDVKTGLSDGTITEIVSGDLKEGEQVITEAIVAGKPVSTGAPPRMGRMF
ncbi:MAG: efflux RND transporter periplasmic adaptor subunit [Labilithrix sp.]|nr:efflux RND transporter periplasmic adaptor subunit [Labilithrix sp.]MCW5816265.1 efflux RND transporter periplasmic adaptor subunit [Labilithrix sp.]